MEVRIARLCVFALVVSAAGLVVDTQPASACGGFFCNAVSQSPIFQAGERVVFSTEPGGVTMDIEVSYEGDPTEFGWIVPIVEPPAGADGEPTPLEEMLTLSTPDLFAALQASTDPSFRVTRMPDIVRGCRGGSGGSFGCAASEESTSARSVGASVDEDSGWQAVDGVEVADEARVGPYEAQLLRTKSTDALYDWLAVNGYLQDPAARALLGHYVHKQFSFIGLRLRTGRATGDIAPVRLRLGEDAPCVPLRLTAIAATPGMPMRVWVVGPGRAVPKNYLHAVLDDRALVWPGAANYPDAVAQAVAEAGGRAFVTEYAGPTTPALDALPLKAAPDYPVLALAPSERALRAELVALGLSTDAGKLGQVWAEEAYHPTSDGEELVRLKARVIEEVVRPLDRAREMLVGGLVLTRLYTRIDPEAMIRDPIFTFNTELPMVASEHTVEATRFVDESCNEYAIFDYDSGFRYTWTSIGGGLGPVPGVSALARVEVLDATGQPVIVDPADVDDVDAVLHQAQLGRPSIPVQLQLVPPDTEEEEAYWPNPPESWDGEEACATAPVQTSAHWLLALLGTILLLIRRSCTTSRSRSRD